MVQPIRLVIVIGPTASGKTGLGMQLARAIGGEILSADSMQIYRYMDIGTAKPTPQELAAVPHHLINILEPNQSYSAGRFLADADRIVSKLARRRKPIIVVGGTALYIRALLRGMAEAPASPPEVRKEVRDLAERCGLSACFDKLTQLDPESAKVLHPNDTSRICRALEVVLHTGRSIREFQAAHRFQTERYKGYYLGIWWERDHLYDRIDQRVTKMVRDGLLEEVAALLDRGYGENLPPMRSIGYRQAVQRLKGRLTEEEMVREIRQKTRRYAKKQITWYQKDRSVRWLDRGKWADSQLQGVIDFLHSTSTEPNRLGK